MRTWRRIYYDKFSRVYDRFVALHSSDRQGSLRRFLAEQVAAASGRTVLDLCTGTGALQIELHSRIGGGLIVELDFSAGMLSAARQKKRHCHEVALVQAEADRLPFKTDVFDAITCAHAFYELKAQAQGDCLTEICRTPKSDRSFFLMEHEVPRNRIVRLLFYIRLLSMGARQALRILKYERRFLLVISPPRKSWSRRPANPRCGFAGMKSPIAAGGGFISYSLPICEIRQNRR